MERKQRRSKTSKVKLTNNKGIKKVEEKYQKKYLERKKKRLIEDERNEEKNLIEINGGQENKKQKKRYIKSATIERGNQGKVSHCNCRRDFNQL